MSGGSFGYRQWNLVELANMIRYDVASSEIDIHKRVRRKAKNISDKLFHLFVEVELLDKYISGDISLESYLETKEK